jgi:hypothetical protein
LWVNKTAVEADYALSGVTLTNRLTDWLPLYDELGEGLIEEEGDLGRAV